MTHLTEGERSRRSAATKRSAPRPRRRLRRPCLRCQQPFRSEGPHNRICPVCKETRSWTDWP